MAFNDNSASIGAALGSGIGAFLSDRLDNLAMSRAEQLQQRQMEAKQQRTASLLKNLGFAPEEADFVSRLPEKYVAEFGRDYLSSRFNQPESMEQEVVQSVEPNISQRLATLGIDEPQQQQRKFNINELITNPLVSEPIRQALSQNQVVQPEQIQKTDKPSSNRLKEEASKPVQEIPEEVLQRVESPRKPTLSQVLSRSNQKSDVSSQDQKRIDKETLPYYNQVLKADATAYDSEKRLKRMKTLVDKGSLPISTFYKLFKNLEEHVSPTTGAAVGAGIGGLLGAPAGPLGSLAVSPVGAAIGGAVGGLVQPVANLLRSAQQFTSPDTDEFEKLSNDFVRDAKGIFGNRVTDADLKVFLSMVPTLAQTDNGKKAIIRNMENFLQGVHVRTKVMKDIIKENKGRRPDNLEIMVEDRARSELDKLSEEFNEGVDKSANIVKKTPEKKRLFPENKRSGLELYPQRLIPSSARNQ